MMAKTTSITQRAISTNTFGSKIGASNPSTAALLNLIRTMMHGKIIGILNTGISNAPLLVLEANADNRVKAAPILTLPSTSAIMK